MISQIRVNVVNQSSSGLFLLLKIWVFLEESFQMRLDRPTLVSLTLTLTITIPVVITSLPQVQHLITSGGGNSCDITQINVVVSQT